MTVHPLSFGGVTRPPEHFKDSTTGHPSVTVLSQRGGKPADPCGTRDGVQAESPDTGGVVAVDGVTHRVVVVVVILQGQQGVSTPSVCDSSTVPSDSRDSRMRPARRSA